MTTRLVALTVGLALIAHPAARAQEQPAAAAPPAPTAPALSFDSIDGDRLAPGTWSYVQTVTRRDATVELGQRVLTVSAASEGGRPAWLLVDEMHAHGQIFRDSLFVRRGDLRPIRQHGEVGPMSVRLAFPGDSVTGTIELPGAPTIPVALGGSPHPVVSAGMLESLLTLVPLDSGWAASVGQLVVSPVGTAVLPITLTVVGEETVTVPAGTFPAWVVEISTTETAQHLWLDRATGRLLRARNPAPGMPDVVYETVLERQ